MSTKAPSLAEVIRGKQIAVVSHSLQLTGAPKLAAELANVLLDVGEASRVLLTVLEPPFASEPTLTVELRKQLEILLPNAFPQLEIAANVNFDALAKFDAIVIGSARSSSAEWIKLFRRSCPDYNRLMWWIHEGEAAVEMDEISVQHVHERLHDVDALAFETWAGQV